MEKWMPILGHEDTHMISNLGRVKSLPRKCRTKGGGQRSVPGRIMKTSRASNGYPTVQLKYRGKTHLVHRLVAEAFIPRPDWATQVNHIDGDKSNNTASNLEWTTQSLNQLHAYERGLQAPYAVGGSEHPKARGVRARMVTGEHVGDWGCVSDCARDLNIRLGSVFRVLRGVRGKYRGMTFEYLT